MCSRWVKPPPWLTLLSNSLPCSEGHTGEIQCWDILDAIYPALPQGVGKCWPNTGVIQWLRMKTKVILALWTKQITGACWNRERLFLTSVPLANSSSATLGPHPCVAQLRRGVQGLCFSRNYIRHWVFNIAQGFLCRSKTEEIKSTNKM